MTKTCKNCGDRFLLSSNSQKYCALCKSIVKKIHDKGRCIRNMVDVKRKKKIHYSVNREKILRSISIYVFKNRNKVLESASKRSKHNVEILSDFYIAKLLGIKKSICPPELIAAKRAQLQLLRLTKEKQP